MFITILTFVGVLLVLVLVHELGHFWAARKLGVQVEEFGFGFPPRAYSWVRRGVVYSLNWLPLGGFVKLKGENGEAKLEPGSFAAAAAWRRSVILVAGVAMNILLAFVLLTVGFTIGFRTLVSGDQIIQAKDVKIQISSLVASSPAAEAGLQPGDEIISLDSNTFADIKLLQDYTTAQAGQSIKVQIDRQGKKSEHSLIPKALPESGNRPILGVGLMQTGILSYTWYEAIWQGARATWNLGVEIIVTFGKLIKNLVVSHEVPADLAGPVGIAVITGQVIKMGIIYLIQFAALISLNLAIINVLPLPALDGGRLLFVIIEKIRRKPNNERVEAIIHQIGFSLLMVLVVLITYRDIVRLSSGFFTKFIGN